MVRDLKYLHVFEEGKCSRRPVISNSLDHMLFPAINNEFTSSSKLLEPRVDGRKILCQYDAAISSIQLIHDDNKVSLFSYGVITWAK